jgi:hypothetical protein
MVLPVCAVISDGDYILYVRAVDPAGNSDERYIPGRNWYSWHYVSPIPWDIIFGSLGAFFCKQQRTIIVGCIFVDKLSLIALHACHSLGACVPV